MSASCALIFIDGLPTGIDLGFVTQLKNLGYSDATIDDIVKKIISNKYVPKELSFKHWLEAKDISGVARIKKYLNPDGQYITAIAVKDYLKFLEASIKTKNRYEYAGKVYSTNFTRKMLDAYSGIFVNTMMSKKISPYSLVSNKTLFADITKESHEKLKRVVQHSISKIKSKTSPKKEDLLKFLESLEEAPFLFEMYFTNHLAKAGIKISKEESKKVLPFLQSVFKREMEESEEAEETVDNDAEDTGPEEIYSAAGKRTLTGKDSFEFNKIGNAPFGVKFIMSFLPNVQLDKSQNRLPILEKEYGLLTTVPVKKVKAFIGNFLSNNPAQYEKLKEALLAAKKKFRKEHWINSLVNYMDNLEGEDAVKFQAEFVQYAANHNYKFVTDLLNASSLVDSRSDNSTDTYVGRHLYNSKFRQQAYASRSGFTYKDHYLALEKTARTLVDKKFKKENYDEEAVEFLKQLGIVDFEFADIQVLDYPIEEVLKVDTPISVREYIPTLAQYLSKQFVAFVNEKDEVAFKQILSDYVKSSRSPIREGLKNLTTVLLPSSEVAMFSHRTPDKKTVHNININSFISSYLDNIDSFASDIINSKNRPKTLVDALNRLTERFPELGDPLLKNNPIVRSIVNAIIKGDQKALPELEVLSGLTVHAAKNRSGVKFKKYGTAQYLFSSAKSIAEGRFVFPRLGDRGTEYMVKVPNTVINSSRDSIIDFMFRAAVDEVASTAYAQEVLNTSKYSPVFINRITKNLKLFQFLIDPTERKSLGLPEQPPFTLEELKSLKLVSSGDLQFVGNKEASVKLIESISEFLDNEANKLYLKIKKEGLIHQNDISIIQRVLPSSFLSPYFEQHGKNLKGVGFALRALSDSLVASYLTTSNFFVGDAAVFENDIEYFKRMALLSGTKKASAKSEKIDGYLLDTIDKTRAAYLSKGKYSEKQKESYESDTLRTLVIEDIKGTLDPLILDQYKKEFYESFLKDALARNESNPTEYAEKRAEDAIRPYKDYKASDAAAYITIDELRRLLIKDGSWDFKEDQKVYEKLVSSKALTAEDFNRMASFTVMLKPQSFSKLKGVQNKNLSTARKISVFPLIPQFLPKGSRLQKLEEQMSKNGIGLATHPSGIKFGHSIPINVNNALTATDLETYVDSTSFSDFAIQVDNYVKEKETVAESVQKSKLISVNQYENGKPINLEKAEKIEKFVLLRNYAVAKRTKAFFKSILKNEKIDLTDLSASVINNGIALGIPSNTLENIALNLSKGFIDLDVSGSYIENMITSAFRNRVIKSERVGTSTVQNSSALWDTKEVDYLKPYRKSSVTGELLPMEVSITIPENYLEFAKENYGETSDYLLKFNRDIAHDNALFEQYHSGNITQEEYESKVKLPQDIFKLILFRTPNQGPSSSEFARVHSFLPKVLEGVSNANSTIVVKTGSDFDYDKLSVYYLNLNKGLITTAGVNKKLISKAMDTASKEADLLLNNEDQTQEILKEEVLSYVKNVSVQTDAEQISLTIAANVISNLSSYEIKRVLDSSEVEMPDMSDFGYDSSDLHALVKTVTEQALYEYKNRKFEETINSDDKLAGLSSDDLSNYTFLLEYDASIPDTSDDIRGFLYPLDTKDLNEVVNKIKNLRGIVETKSTGFSSVLSPSNSLSKQEALLQTNSGIGIIANHLTHHATSQKTGMQIRDFGQSLIGKGTYKNVASPGMVSIAHIRSIDGDYISENLSQVLSAFIDIAKNDFPVDANLTEKTAGIAAFLLRSGLSKVDVLLFLTNPVAIQYFKTEQLIAAGMSSERKAGPYAYFVFNEMFRSTPLAGFSEANKNKLIITNKKYNALQKELSKNEKSVTELLNLEPISRATMQKMISDNADLSSFQDFVASPIFKEHGMKFLKLFASVQKASSSFNNFTGTASPDSKRFKNIIQLANQIQLHESSGKELGVKVNGANTSVDGFFKAKQAALEFLQSVSILTYYDPTGQIQKEVFEDINKDFNLTFREKEQLTERAKQIFLKYLITFKLKAQKLDLTTDSPRTKKLTTGKNSLPSKLFKLKKVLPDNAFLNKLLFNFEQGVNGADLMLIDNISDSKDDTANIQDGAMYLKSFLEENNLEQTYLDLLDYAFLMSDSINKSSKLLDYLPAGDVHKRFYDVINPELSSDLLDSVYVQHFPIVYKGVTEQSAFSKNKYLLGNDYGVTFPTELFTVMKEKTDSITASIKTLKEYRSELVQELRNYCMFGS